MEYEQKNKIRNYFGAASLALFGLHYGYYFSILNILWHPMMTQHFGYDEVEDENILATLEGLANTMLAIGAVLGCWSISLFADKFGRRRLLIIGDVLGIIAPLLYLPANLPIFMIARFIGGLFIGMSNVNSCVILGELFPGGVCSFGNTFNDVLLELSAVFAFLPQNLMSQEDLGHYYRYFLVVPVFVPIIKLIGVLIFLPNNTPRYIYLSTPDEKEMKKAIRECVMPIYADKDVEEVVNTKIEYFDMQKTVEEVGFKNCFKKHQRKRFLSSLVGLISTPIGGIMFVFAYSNNLTEEITPLYEVLTLTISITNFVGSMIALFITHHIGRKKNLVIGNVLFGIFHGVLFVAAILKHDVILFFGFICYILTFAISVNPSSYTYVSETLGPTGAGIVLSGEWITTAVIGQFGIMLLPAIKARGIFLIFAIMTIIMAWILYVMLIETKGKSEKEIELEFRDKRYDWIGCFKNKPKKRKSKKNKDNEKTKAIEGTNVTSKDDEDGFKGEKIPQQNNNDSPSRKTKKELEKLGDIDKTRDDKKRSKSKKTKKKSKKVPDFGGRENAVNINGNKNIPKGVRNGIGENEELNNERQRLP